MESDCVRVKESLREAGTYVFEDCTKETVRGPERERVYVPREGESNATCVYAPVEVIKSREKNPKRI